MPTIWKLTFQEPDASGLLDRLLGEAKNQESQLAQTQSVATATPPNAVHSPKQALAA